VKNLKEIIIKVSASVMIMFLMVIMVTGHTGLMAGNYYQESLYFDEDGNFYMTTHDIIGTKNTRYCTLGWTIKRYNLPIDDPLNMSATIVITCDGSVEDPENERYLYSFFYCDKETIFNAIGRVSEEWQRELYLNGATVYLDGIMTVLENNVPQGSLYSDGSRSGEVYDTYEGIVSARGWGPNSRDSLRTHFNKSVYFPAVEDFFADEEEGDITREKREISQNYYWWGPDLSAGVNVSADEYNPSKAIPAGEKVTVYGWQQTGAYNIEYEKVSGKIACEIPIILLTERPGTDEKGQEVMLKVQISEGIYQYMIPYTYYALESVELYYADGMVLSSDIFSEDIYLNTGTSLDIESRIYGDAEHVRCAAVKETVIVDIGTLTDEEEIKACIEAVLQGVASMPEVRNDYLAIGDFVVMSDEWTENVSAPYRVSLSGGSAEVNIVIPVTIPNAEYSIKAKAYYRCESTNGYGSSHTTRTVSDAGKITVHTPVVCYGEVLDVKDRNQSEIPSADVPTIILGREFEAVISNEGEHIDAKGYGTKDYGKYVLYNQVRFPFEVLYGEEKPVEAGEWITLEEDKKLVLPVMVQEGEYEIEFRAVAINYDKNLAEGEGVGQNANLLPEQQIAADKIVIKVIGQIYDFELTEIVKYKAVIDLEKEIGKCNVSMLPLKWESEGLPFGSYFKFKIKSVGGYCEESRVTITPTFWYEKDDEHTEVDIYYEDIRKDGQVILKKWTTVEHKLELTGEDCQVVDTGKLGNYADEDYGKYQVWSGNYRLPMKSFCVPVNRNLPEYSVDSSSFLTEGRLLIKFEIRLEDKNGENVLLYVNSENAKKGYCNRWKKEGGKDGEVIYYNIGKSVKDDMKITGTH